MSGSAAKLPNLERNEDGKQKVPRWLPVSLLALTTAALTVPAVLLWRQKRALGPQIRVFGRNQLEVAPPARRRPGTSSTWVQFEGSSRQLASSSKPSTSSAPPPRRTSTRSKALAVDSVTTRKTESLQSSEVQGPVSFVDGPLMSLDALGLATGAVGVAMVLGVWGVQRTMGVQTVDEFAIRVRQILLSRLPALSRRIYRSPSEDDSTEDSSSDSPREWEWDAAEERLRTAFEQGGVGEWAECAVRELEAEEKVERARRGL